MCGMLAREEGTLGKLQEPEPGSSGERNQLDPSLYAYDC